MKLKRITSLLLSWSFILMILTSIVLYVMPQGKIAYWANWSWGGLDKETWGAVHTNLGFLFLIACALHVFFNWKHILNYIRNKGAQIKLLNANNAVSLLIVVLVAIFTVIELPPMSWIQDLGHHFKDQAIDKYGSPPYGHAELSSLEEFCRRTGTELDQATKALKKEGISAKPDQSILEIADAASMTPQALASIFSSEEVLNSNKEGNCSDRSNNSGKIGYGQKTLQTVCDELSRDYDEVAAQLKAAGFRPQPNVKLKDIAGEKGERASAIMAILLPEGH